MIIYSPLDGEAITSSIPIVPKRCFLMTRLGEPIPKQVACIRQVVTYLCKKKGLEVIDANSQVTGRDFLLKIWKLIASSPLSIGICHEETPISTQLNIYYELGVAQALGNETLVIRSPKAEMPSNFVRTEYIEFDRHFEASFTKFLISLHTQAEHYERLADQLERSPILAIDYLKRAFLISGDDRLTEKIESLMEKAGLKIGVGSSVEVRDADSRTKKPVTLRDLRIQRAIKSVP